MDMTVYYMGYCPNLLKNNIPMYVNPSSNYYCDLYIEFLDEFQYGTYTHYRNCFVLDLFEGDDCTRPSLSDG